MKIAFLHEHPSWSDALLAAFAEGGLPVEPVNMAALAFDTNGTAIDFDLAINRINIMPSAERDPQVVFQTLHYLRWLEQAGVRVVNGSGAHFVGASKALQNGLFASLGLAHPAAVAIYRQTDALEAAENIGYPVIVKPNIGGSGSGVAKFDKREELADAIRIKALDLGVDRTGIVQQYIRSDGYVYRVEVLGGELFYSIRQPVQEGSFNYCAADGCAIEPAPSAEGEFDFCAVDGGRTIESFAPPDSVIADVVSVVAGAGADFGGVEYFMDTTTGAPSYYDFNPYSNFVTDGESLLGFSPEARFVDFIRGIAGQVSREGQRQIA